jgi:alginate O-acetyltransferase complex protein AlgJ
MATLSANPPTARRTNAVQRAFDRLLVLLFAAALAAPFVDRIVRSDDARGPEPERRLPTPAPAFPRTLATLLAFPREFEKYWNDSFGLRDVLLRWHSLLKVSWLGVSPDDRHVIGKDLWVYNQTSDIIDNWRGAIPFSATQLEAWRQRLERRRDAARAAGAHYLFAVVPDKPQIYPEYVPPRFAKIGPSRMDQLFEHMRAHSDVDVLDLRPALLAERANDDPDDFVYYPLGTHWQMRGAIAGFNAFVDHLRPRFPRLRNLPMSAHTERAERSNRDSELYNMYIGDFRLQTDHWWDLTGPAHHRRVENDETLRRQVFVNDDQALPRVVMFHDSFGPYFENEWAEVCSRFAMSWSYDFDLGLVRRERPDCVVEFVVERALVFQDPTEITPGEADPESRFASARPLIALDVEHPALRQLFGSTFATGRDDAGPYVQLTIAGPLESFWIDGVPPVAGQTLMARLDVETAEPGSVALHWRAGAEADWSPDRKVEARVLAGRNTVWLVLPAQRLPLEGLVLRPLDRPGTCRLRSLAVRAIDAAARTVPASH